MGSFASSLASTGGGGGSQAYDPSAYLGGGQSQDGGSAGGQTPQGQQGSGPSPDFVQSIGRMGMQIEQQIDTLSGQYPEAAEDLRTAKMALKKGMAKILTTNPKANGGPMAPRSV
jgi:hypothetical protein